MVNSNAATAYGASSITQPISLRLISYTPCTAATNARVPSVCSTAAAMPNTSAKNINAIRSPLAAAATGFLGTMLSRSEEHTSELQSLMRISYAVFCLQKKKINITKQKYNTYTQVNTQHHR